MTQGSEKKAERSEGQPSAARRPLFRWSVVLVLMVLGLAVALMAGWRTARDVLSEDALLWIVKGELASYYRGRIEMGRVQFDPFQGIVIDDAKLFDGVGPEALLVAQVPRVVVAHKLEPLLGGELVIDSVEALDPLVHLREDHGGWNVARLLRFKDEDEASPFPAVLNGIWAEAATVTVRSRTIFEDDEVRTFRNCDAKFRPFSCSLKIWEFEGLLRDDDWGAFDLEGRFDVDAQTTEATIVCPGLDVTPEFLRSRVPHVGVTVADKWQPSGRAAVKAKLTFDANRDPKWNYDVDIVFEDASSTPQVWPVEISHISGRVIVHNHLVYLRDLAGLLKAGDHVARPTVDGFVDLAKNHSILQVRVQDLALAKEVVAAAPKPQADLWQDYHWKDDDSVGLLNGEVTLEFSGKDLSSLDYQGKAELRDCKIIYTRFPVRVTDIMTRLELTKDTVKTVDLSASLCGGRIDHGSLAIDLSQEPFTFEASLNLTDIDIKTLFGEMQGGVQGEVQPGQKLIKLAGRVSGDVEIKGKGTDLAQLEGDGRLELKDALLWETPIISEIVRLLPLTSPATDATQRGSAECRIENGMVKVKKATLTSGRIDLHAEGDISLDREAELDLTVVAALDPHILGDIPVITDVTSKVLGRATRAVRKVRVTGPAADFKVEPIAFRPFLRTGESIADLLHSLGPGKKPKAEDDGQPKDGVGLLNPFKKLFNKPKEKGHNTQPQ